MKPHAIVHDHSGIRTYGAGKNGTDFFVMRDVHRLMVNESLQVNPAATPGLVSIYSGSAENGAIKARFSDGTTRVMAPHDNLFAQAGSSTNWPDGAGALAGTLTNSPKAGNPTKWIPIDDNGTTRYIPVW